MSWKKTDLERLNAAKLSDRLAKSAPPERYGRESDIVSRREQRRRDQAAGLVPFAVKLPQALVRQLQEKAAVEKRPLGEVTAELLGKALKS